MGDVVRTVLAAGRRRLTTLLDRVGSGRVWSLLGNRDFRWLFAGCLVGRLGDKLYFVAALWLTHELTGSTVFVGVAAFLTRIPQAIGFLLGPLVDRANLRRLLIGSELAQGAVVLAVPLAATFGYLSVELVLGVVGVLALLRRVSAPAEQAALPRIVDESLLPTANSVASSTDRALGAAGEAISGTIIAALGAVALFVVNAMTFLISAATVALVSIPSTEQTGTRPTPSTYVADLRAGLGVIRHSVVGHMVVGAALAGTFTGMATAVLPAFAATFGGAGTFGVLVAAATAGTLVGSLLASQLGSVRFGRVTAGGFLLSALAQVGVAVAGWMPAVLVLYGVAAVPVGVYNVLVSAAIQTGVPNDRLARVSSTTGSLTAVVSPMGLLAGGALGAVLSPATIIGLSALGYLGIGLYWAGVPALRRFPPVTSVEPGAFGPT